MSSHEDRCSLREALQHLVGATRLKIRQRPLQDEIENRVGVLDIEVEGVKLML